MRGTLGAFLLVSSSISLAQADVRERVGSAADVRAVCAAPDPGRVYTTRFSGVALAAFDAVRSRVAVDAGRALRAADGSYELVLHHIAGTGRRPEGALDLAFPATADEAAELGRASRELELTLWYQVATPADGSAVCAEVVSTRGDGVRLAIEPLAFELTRRGERIASGESARWNDGALAGPVDHPVTAPRVVVSPPVLTARDAPASPAAARVARGLAPGVLGCYRRGLAAEPSLRGTLVAGVDVGADGRVVQAHAELDGLGAPEVTSCVLALVRAARFPARPERISIPLRLTD